MTCIVACTRNGETWIGSESAVSDEVSQVRMGSKHWEIAEGVWIGLSGITKVDHFLRGLAPRTLQEGESLLDYVRAELAPAIQAALEEYVHDDDDDEAPPKWEALVVSPGQIVQMHGATSYWLVASDYAACGAGSDVALGALHALRECAAGDSVVWALEAACYHVPGCAEPLRYNRIGGPTVSET